jgi:hypothetical protein
MTRILITGNPNKGLAHSLGTIWPNADFVSRENGWDLSKENKRTELAQRALNYDIFVNNSALWRFQQSLILNEVYMIAKQNAHPLRIICLGSTTDRVRKGSDWLYQQEKIALRNMCNSLALMGVWNGGPRVSLLSLGTLSNNQHKHLDRRCMDINTAARYVQWVAEQPYHLSINELSIDPIQGCFDVS